MASGNAGGAVVGSRFIVRETSDGLGIIRGKTYNFGADMEAEERSAVYRAILRRLPQARAAEEADED